MFIRLSVYRSLHRSYTIDISYVYNLYSFFLSWFHYRFNTYISFPSARMKIYLPMVHVFSLSCIHVYLSSWWSIYAFFFTSLSSPDFSIDLYTRLIWPSFFRPIKWKYIYMTIHILSLSSIQIYLSTYDLSILFRSSSFFPLFSLGRIYTFKYLSLYPPFVYEYI